MTREQWDLVKNVCTLTAVLLAAGTALVRMVRWIRPRWREWHDRQTLTKRVGAELYDVEQIRTSTAYYIRPDCQSVDPSGVEDFRRVVSAREPLFDTMDRLLENPGQYKFVILLADSGMGKTSFLLNYYAYHWRSRRRKLFQLSLVPLNLPNSDKLIAEIPAERQNQTVLCLDALDEDRQAIQDHRQRLSGLIELARGFRTVLITSRTQFFPKEEEIPTETGILKVAPVAPSEARAFYFHKLYLAPFTDAQVEKYIKQRFPFWLEPARRTAREIVAKIPDLVARPMLLAHVPDLVSLNKKIDYLFQIYEVMVAAWLEREKGFVEDSITLREFSERLALDLFINRASRQMERIPAAELHPLADKYGIRLEAWQLRGRSLLNRDAQGNYKFAHRSIMEYLFIKGFLSRGLPQNKEPWTDLMKAFLLEVIHSGSATHVQLAGADLSGTDLRRIDLRDVDLSGADLRGVNLSGVNLSGMNLTGVTLKGANLSAAYLRKSNLSRADLSGMNLSGIDLRETNLTGADLAEANLDAANLSKANLNEADLSRANLVAADLSEANLNEAHLSGANLYAGKLVQAGLIGADLRSANLSKADLSKATLDKADLTKADLSGANLTATKFCEAHLSGANLVAAILGGADLGKANLSKAVLDRADLRGANLSATNLSEVDFRNVNLTNANLSGSNLSGANLRRSNLCWTNLNRADLSEADLSEGNLESASLQSATLNKADLRGTNLRGVNLSEANMNGANLSGADMRRANLSGANLSEADLSGADLSGADLRAAKNFVPEQISSTIMDFQTDILM